MALQTTLEHYNVLEYFSQEIIEIILCRYDDITTQDFVNLFSTCSHLYIYIYIYIYTYTSVLFLCSKP